MKMMFRWLYVKAKYNTIFAREFSFHADRKSGTQNEEEKKDDF